MKRARRDRGRLVVVPERVESPLARQSTLGSVVGPLVFLEDANVGVEVGRFADSDEWINQAAPGDRIPGFAAVGDRDDPAGRVDLGLSPLNVSDLDSNGPVLAAPRVGETLLEKRLGRRDEESWELCFGRRPRFGLTRGVGNVGSSARAGVGPTIAAISRTRAIKAVRSAGRMAKLLL